ncbi:hypothetical protein evm_014137 [Chilo suppressalis]|nr:hypothetical protein evm_014137 [Chilo suppressalis]
MLCYFSSVNECKRTKKKSPYRDYRHRTTRIFSTFPLPQTKRICVKTDNTLRGPAGVAFTQAVGGIKIILKLETNA